MTTAQTTYSTRFAAKRAALKAFGDDAAFKLISVGDRFAFEAVATDKTSLPKSRMIDAPPVIQDGGPGFLRLRANADAEAMRQNVLNDERKLAAIPPSREGAAAAPSAASVARRAATEAAISACVGDSYGSRPKAKTPEDAALAHDLAKANASEKAAAKRAVAGPAPKPSRLAYGPDMIGDRLTGLAAETTLKAILTHGKGSVAKPTAETLGFYEAALAISCLRKLIASKALTEIDSEGGHAALVALGAIAVDASGVKAPDAPAKAESTAPKAGTRARGIFDMLRRPEGATAKEMTAAGFKDVSCVSSAKQFAARFGLGWRAEKEGKFDRVWLTDAPTAADQAPDADKAA